MIHVIVIDDSPFVCRVLTNLIQSTPDLKVIGTAHEGAQAVRMIKELRPDVVTLDLEMPGMSGLETLEQIMHERPTPVVLVSGVSRDAAQTTMRGITLGAVEFVLKYTPGVDTDPETLRREITNKVRAASQIKVVRSLRVRQSGDAINTTTTITTTAPVVSPVLSPTLKQSGIQIERQAAACCEVIVIGASTGGPVALRDLLGTLPADFPAAVLVVQHMPAAFTPVLAAQLNRQIALRVKEAEERELLQPGTVLIAPGGFHLRLTTTMRVRLSDNPEGEPYCPSIDITMQSFAESCGARLCGIVLTGMGDDGARGLAAIRLKGGQTFAQDAASCVINGMPQRAIDKGVVDFVATPTGIAHLLKSNCAMPLTT